MGDQQKNWNIFGEEVHKNDIVFAKGGGVTKNGQIGGHKKP